MLQCLTTAVKSRPVARAAVFCGTPIQQPGVEHSLDLGRRGRTPPLVSRFPIAFVLFWCSWLLRGHGAGGEVEGGKVKPCSPANLASCEGGAGYQHQPTQSSEQVVQEEVKTLLCR